MASAAGPAEPAFIQARNLHELVVQQLGLMIGTGELQVGAQIVPELYGTRFGASRGVVREALRVLEAKGMVRPRPRTGTRVCPMEDWDLLDPDVIAWRVRGPDRAAQLSDLLDLRVSVEPFAARLCCRTTTEEDVAELDLHLARMREAGLAGRHHEFTEADVAFHTRILRASGNGVFARFERPFAAILLAREELETLPAQVQANTIELHARIVRAIAEHDEARAEECARELIESSRAELLAQLGRRA